MTMTWEQAQAHIDALNQQVNILTDQLQQLTTRAAVADTQRQQIHQELERTKVLLAVGGKGQEFKLIDPKTMCPNKLGTEKSLEAVGRRHASIRLNAQSPTCKQPQTG